LVTDNNNCSATASVTITQPSAIRDSLSSVSYPGCSTLGSATVGVTGGTGPYTYTWNPNVSSTSSATGLSVGTYTVTIKDNHNCSSVLDITISQAPGLRDSIVTSATRSIDCKGDDDGYITLGVAGGQSPYTYTWTPNVGSTAEVSNLSVGTYSVTVKDANGCTGTLAKFTITQPSEYLHDSISVLLNVGCYGGGAGEISVGTRGGTPPYTYVWTPNVSTRYTASNLSVGTYTIVASDNHGCSQTEFATITQPAASLVVTDGTITNPKCSNSKGSASVNVTGGTPAYTYKWVPNVSTTSTCSDISAGTYTVTVKDAHGCDATVLVTITAPAPIRDSMVTADKQNVTCRGDANGSATVGVKGGTGPYTYSWIPNGATTATATGLSAGEYTITVIDANGCSGTAALTTITVPAAALDDSVYSEKCVNNLVTATLTVSGGTPPYTYLWEPGSGTKGQMTGLSAGVYTITVTDNHGCSKTISKDLICGGIIKGEGDENPTAPPQCCAGLDDINLYPNPNTGQFSISGLTKGMIIEMYDYTGRKITTTTATDLTMQLSLAEQANGIYLVRILSPDGTLVSQKKVVKTQ